MSFMIMLSLILLSCLRKIDCFVIVGSPYHPKVTDPRRVKVVGGWHSIMDANNRLYLKVGEEKRISFDIAEAGPGI